MGQAGTTSRTQINLRLPADLVAAIDRERDGVSRNRYIEGAVRARLKWEVPTAPPTALQDAGSPPRTSASCPEHPEAGTIRNRGALWCAAPGCLRRLS
jgi:hypothetical protein